MGDMGDDFNAIRKHSQVKRAMNREASTDMLRAEKIEFVSKNNGAHLIIGEVDFYPGTGLWRHRHIPRQGRGVRNLIRFVKESGDGKG